MKRTGLHMNRSMFTGTLPLLPLLSVLLVHSCLLGCKRTPPTIAVIPRTCGTALWEPEHAGAAALHVVGAAFRARRDRLLRDLPAERGAAQAVVRIRLR